MQNNKSLKQAIILAGGFGTRLAHIVTDVPKPLAPIDGTPFLSLLIRQLEQNGFNDFILLTGYQSEMIEAQFTQHPHVRCVRETTPLGTGGAVLNAFDYLADDFFIINGDTFFDIDFSLLQDFANTKKAAMALRYSTDISRYGLVDIDENFCVTGFIEKGQLPSDVIDGYINGGIYYFKKETLKPFWAQFNNNKISIETEIFPQLIAEKSLYALPLGGAFIDIGVPEDYARAQQLIPTKMAEPKKPALFVDKDGTLIVNTGYPAGPDIQPILATLELVKSYQEKGFHLVMVTNQAGLAKDKFTPEAMWQNIQAIQNLYAQHGIHFDEIEYCPYHSEGSNPQYTYRSKARKPEAGMILSVCEKINIDLRHSVMVGDNAPVDTIHLPYLQTIILEETCSI